MPVRMTREGRAETREAKRTEQYNQKSKSGKAAGFSSTSQKGNIVHGKLKSQKELKKITGSEDYKKSDNEGKTKMLNVATANKGMSVKQKKIAAKAPPPDVFNEKDLAVLRAEKAKGRGMGLQDEKVQPGKVQKAGLGKIIKGVGSMFKGKGRATSNPKMVNANSKSSGMGSMLPKLLQKAIEDGAIKTAKQGKMMKAKRGKLFQGYLGTFDASAEASTPKAQRGVTTIVGVKPNSAIGRGKKKRVTYKSMDEMRQKTLGYKKGESTEAFKKRRMKLEGAAKALKATRVGKILLPIVGAGVAAKTYLNSKMKKDKNKKTLKDFREQKKPGVPSGKTKTINSALNKLKAKKMGGGMMQKPMGYTTGGMGPAGAMAPDQRRQGPKGGIGSLPKKRKDDDIVIVFSTKDGTKKIKRSDLDNMSAPKKKMGGGMMKRPMGYKKGKEIDYGKIFDKKFYKLAQGKEAQLHADNYDAGLDRAERRAASETMALMKKNKKMGGGMMQRPMGYNTGGYKSKQDRKKAEKNIKEARSKEGLRSFLSGRTNPMRKERYMEGRKARHTEFKKKIGRTALSIASSLNPVTSIGRGIGKVMGKGSKKRDFQKGDYGDISVKKMGGGMMQKPMGYKGGGMDTGKVGEMKSRVTLAVDRLKKAKKFMGRGTGRLTDSDKEKIKSLVGKGQAIRPIKKMGGGMMQKPMGYRSGTMVKARGCKLGRTRPTKIT